MRNTPVHKAVAFVLELAELQPRDPESALGKLVAHARKLAAEMRAAAGEGPR